MRTARAVIVADALELGGGGYTAITLYSPQGDCWDSHRLRMILAEKDIHYKLVENVNLKKPPPDLRDVLHGGETLPLLVDRDLVVSDVRIISEYLDERFPYPPLLPIDPVARAKMRMFLMYFEAEWLTCARAVVAASGKQAETAARRAFSRRIQQDLAEFFPRVSPSAPYLNGRDLTLADCVMAPILWRLPALGVKIPPAKSRALERYQRAVFRRASFRGSLTVQEVELRPE